MGRRQQFRRRNGRVGVGATVAAPPSQPVLSERPSRCFITVGGPGAGTRATGPKRLYSPKTHKGRQQKKGRDGFSLGEMAEPTAIEVGPQQPRQGADEGAHICHRRTLTGISDAGGFGPGPQQEPNQAGYRNKQEAVLDSVPQMPEVLKCAYFFRRLLNVGWHLKGLPQPWSSTGAMSRAFLRQAPRPWLLLARFLCPMANTAGYVQVPIRTDSEACRELDDR